uniref:Uncharacterized protein n=1 Tax=Arundo donax TaxID=35708 RepID=A0A0A9FAD9_ARUDO
MSPTAVNISDSPNTRNCGAIQKMERSRPPWTLSERLRASTSAAATMENVTAKRPTPMRWSGVIPVATPVRRRTAGTKAAS